MDNFRVVCVNDSAKPDGFIGEWIKKDEIYTVVDAKNLARQRMTLGIQVSRNYNIRVFNVSVFSFKHV